MGDFMKRVLTVALILMGLGAVIVPAFTTDASAATKCTRVYTTSGWITRCG